MVSAFIISVILLLDLVAFINAILIGVSLILLIGVLDDLNEIRPRIKFAGQILATLGFILVSGRELYGLGNLLGIGPIDLGILSLPFTVFCIVGVTNALNLSDGLDGLAGGIGFIATLFFTVLALEAAQWHSLAVLFCLLGCLLGFLRFNSHPASLFMGDSGSLFLGFTLGCLAVSMTVPEQGSAIAPIQLCAPLWIPIFDTLYVIVSRLAKGESPLYPDKRHLHHRLMNMGTSHYSAVSIIYGLSILLSLACWSVRNYQDWLAFAICIAASSIIYTFLLLAESHNFRLDSKQEFGISSYLPSRSSLVAQIGRSVKYVRFSFVILLILPALFIIDLGRPLAMFSLPSALLIAIFYPWTGDRSRLPIASGILFYACFLILIFYHFHTDFPQWGSTYLHILTIAAFIWCALRIVFKSKNQILLPSSFEILLFTIAWFIPIVIASILPFSTPQRIQLFWSCFQAVPFITVIKLSMADQAKKNNWLAFMFLFLFLFMGLWAFV